MVQGILLTQGLQQLQIHKLLQTKAVIYHNGVITVGTRQTQELQLQVIHKHLPINQVTYHNGLTTLGM